MVAAGMFVLCLMWSHGLDFGTGSDDYDYEPPDPEEAALGRANGVYVVQYLLDVAIHYAGLLSKQLRSSAVTDAPRSNTGVV
jgi:hypothetical protein